MDDYGNLTTVSVLMLVFIFQVKLTCTCLHKPFSEERIVLIVINALKKEIVSLGLIKAKKY